jgi:phospholipid/cholesterol/gamma-HCH transport system permease protein
MALIVALPLLTFLGDMAALLGGMLTAWGYGGINPTAFGAELKTAIGVNTFMVGIIKAPFMALVIGMVAAMEGFKVQGSAESLGRQVTDSVVIAIFMVIFMDGLFAIFFASIKY